MSRLIDADALIDDCKKYLNKLNPSRDGKECTRIHWLIGILSNAPTIEERKTGKWIPCSERLPKKKRKTYWVCTNTEYQCECRWTNNRFGFGESDNWGWSIFDTPQYTEVIAWMPLPEPYREDIE